MLHQEKFYNHLLALQDALKSQGHYDRIFITPDAFVEEETKIPQEILDLFLPEDKKKKMRPEKEQQPKEKRDELIKTQGTIKEQEQFTWEAIEEMLKTTEEDREHEVVGPTRWTHNPKIADNNPDGVDFALTMAIPIAHKTKRNVEEVAKEICEKTAERIKKYGKRKHKKVIQTGAKYPFKKLCDDCKEKLGDDENEEDYETEENNAVTQVTRNGKTITIINGKRVK
ncbi:10708_t:CDS:2 [Cetraspora pellucida]|uniref:10708_t:CDS:1 n=1 Tax=Cetraspora pellucida TaxID=1433469 RepID=A0ACA9L1W7_9GLOM|nr:10708_t:CDS:2 [Cetraspora pellucida]